MCFTERDMEIDPVSVIMEEAEASSDPENATPREDPRQERPPPIPLVHSVEEIPGLRFNAFKNLPSAEEEHNFFLTQATHQIFEDMKKSHFILTLRSAAKWKLFVSEVMLGVLLYEVPWTETYHPPFLVRKLRDLGRIVVLTQNEEEVVPLPLSAKTEAFCDSLTVCMGLTPHSLLTQLLEFRLKQCHTPIVVLGHTGTMIFDDWFAKSGHKGFPTVFKVEIPTMQIEGLSNMDMEYENTEEAEAREAFVTAIDEIRRRMWNSPRLHYKLVMPRGVDKLVTLWYLKHMAEEFGTKIHVDQHYCAFIQKYVPSYADAFSHVQCYNTRSRFHYNCCEFVPNPWSRELEPGCAFGLPRGYTVDFLCVGYWRNRIPRNFRIPRTTICIPHIHEVIYGLN